MSADNNRAVRQWQDQLVVDALIRIYENGSERIYIFSRSVNLDSAWVPVTNHVREVLGCP